MTQIIRKIDQGAYKIIMPEKIGAILFDSPHSWAEYPADFKPSCRREDLLTSLDAFVDELFSAAPQFGMPLLVAKFPRFYLDVNRKIDDIDPEMLTAPFEGSVNPSAKSKVGMGLIRRFALPNIAVYDHLLTPQQVQQRIDNYYKPYYAALGKLIDDAYQQHGRALHIDCHSMKSRGNAMNEDNGALRPDIVVSDRDHKTSRPEVTEYIAELFRDEGLSVKINDPYKGAELISHYADVSAKKYGIQIELNRAIYMNEQEFTKKPGDFEKLQASLARIIEKLSVYSF